MAKWLTVLRGMVQARPQAARRLAHLAGCAVLALLLLLATGCSVVSARSSSPVEDGKRLFKAECASCHGEKGERIPIAPLDSVEFLNSRGDATLLAVIADGKGVMPAFGKERGGPFDETQVRAVLAYLSVTSGRSSSSTAADEGRQVYLESCTRCHGEKGDRIPAAPLNAKGFLDNRTDSEMVRVIADGKGLMPGWSKSRGGALADEQIRAIVSYLRYNVDAATAQRAREGRELYVGNCLACHGERGDRVPGSSLASSAYLSGLGDGTLISVVSEGKGVMPGFGRAKGGPFGIPETAALLAYLKSWAGLSATSALTGPEQAGAGRDLFLRNCTPCHGESGDRVPGVQLKSPAFLSRETDVVLKRNITQGNAKGMPAWGQVNGGPFSEAQIDAILQYLKSSAGLAAQTAAPAAGGPSSAGGAAGDVIPMSAAAVSKGKDVYTKNCVACHGEMRDQIPTCRLADKDWLSQKGDAGLVQATTNGKPPMMPAWGKSKGGPLADDDIKAVAAYLKDAAGLGGAASAAPTSSAPPAAAPPAVSLTAVLDGPATPALGKEIFTKNCVMCHGADGMLQPNCRLGSKEWVMNMGEDGLRSRIGNGKPVLGMPSWGQSKGGPLNDNQITAIIMYLNAGIKP